LLVLVLVLTGCACFARRFRRINVVTTFATTLASSGLLVLILVLPGWAGSTGRFGQIDKEAGQTSGFASDGLANFVLVLAVRAQFAPGLVLDVFEEARLAKIARRSFNIDGRTRLAIGFAGGLIVFVLVSA
jgi:hypothetical protein